MLAWIAMSYSVIGLVLGFAGRVARELKCEMSCLAAMLDLQLCDQRR